MKRSQPQFSDIIYPAVWPTLVALLVAAILVIERAPLDWTVDCNLAEHCPEFDGRIGAAWLPAAFAFGLAHVAGASTLPFKHQPSLVMRSVRLLIFAAVHFFPFFGAYILFSGAAFGFVAAITIVGFPFVLPAGVLGAGLTAGICLALAAGPSPSPAARWRKVLTRYAIGSAIATSVLTLGCLLFDPSAGNFFDPENPGLTAFIILLCIGLACTLGWTMALSVHWSIFNIATSNAFRAAIAIVVLTSCIFALCVQVFVRNEWTVFPERPVWTAPVANHIREGRPLSKEYILLGGLQFIGERALVVSREMTVRSEMESRTDHKGTDKEVNVFWSVDKSFMQWLLAFRDSVNPTEPLYVVADSGGILMSLVCGPNPNYCERPGPGKSDASKIEVDRAVALDDGDAYQFDSGLIGAALAITYDRTTQSEESKPEQWGRLYCRLNVLNVTSANLSATQVIPCDTDWKAEAQKVRIYVESLFAKDLSGNAYNK